ncbi:MAG: hypothetical protein R3296_09795 [Oleiphilaceae bacterium]|nr:hypothetical protein [Oleiphilaceae bacterium]
MDPATQRGFQEQVIAPVLDTLSLTEAMLSPLLLGAALGGGFCPWLEQGEGLGLYRLKEDWHHRLWDDFIAFRPELASRVRGLASQQGFLRAPHQELVGNIPYATAIAVCGLLRHRRYWPEKAVAGAMTRCWLGASGHTRDQWRRYRNAYALMLRQRQSLAVA